MDAVSCAALNKYSKKKSNAHRYIGNNTNRHSNGANKVRGYALFPFSLSLSHTHDTQTHTHTHTHAQAQWQ